VTERRRSERGSGLLGATLGVAAVVAMVGLCANVAIGLWMRATVDAVAHDAVRAVATAPPDSDLPARAAAELERARSLLGPHGRRVQLRFVALGEDDVVALHVRAPGVDLLPRLLSGGPVVGGLDRTVVMRRERT
jgi:hypothetical protein